jgi:3-hydroxyacyl-CoA dehydrogenase/3a,7a,12a-trihydroxy-5b-cholest-24-enoyl-CoA hydratase
MEEGPKLGNDLIDVAAAMAHVYPEVETRHDEREVLLYALGAGAGGDPRDLRFCYENHRDFAALPTFAVVPALNVALGDELAGRHSPGFNFGLERILHAVQLTELKRPMPVSGVLKHRRRVKAVYDRTKYAAVVTEVRTFDERGEEVALNEFTMTVRGAGGFGGEPGPLGEVFVPPERVPDATVEQSIPEQQALLYRLCGDRNPLHADPDFAEAFGLAKPILHGLCTYAFAARHVLRAFAGDDPSSLQSVRVKFAGPVYPGETLVTEMWRESEGACIVFRCKIRERDKVVLSNAAVQLVPQAVAIAAPTAPPPALQAKPTRPATPGVQVLARLAEKLAPSLLAQVGAVIQLRLTEPPSDWVLDLKNPPGSIQPGLAPEANVALQLADADLAALAGGAKVRELLSQGRLRVLSGDMRMVQKLGFLSQT